MHGVRVRVRVRGRVRVGVGVRVRVRVRVGLGFGSSLPEGSNDRPMGSSCVFMRNKPPPFSARDTCFVTRQGYFFSLS